MTNSTTDSNDIALTDLHPDKADMVADVLRGLTATPKWLSSMYFYDERGSELFDAICETEEYYPTRTELGIMEKHITDIAATLGSHVTLIEYGSGSSLKTRTLLAHLDDMAAYVPVEISKEHLLNTAENLSALFPRLEILPVCADFTTTLDIPAPTKTSARNIVYFPGSTIGNFDPEDALELLKNMRRDAGDNGGVLIGVDLEKDRGTLERAYNDAGGITAAFNLNALEHLNRELGSNFDLGNFSHRAIWNEKAHAIEMHLVSQRLQDVGIGGRTIHFEAGETIHTESSYKYTLPRFAALAERAGFKVASVWLDEQSLFSVQYLEPR